VEAGIEVAINGFEARNWAERNAATLLFAALMTRIFGVKREKDSSELSMKNCLTGKVFFQRYPSLHGFLLDKLADSTTGLEAGTLILKPALYPILLVLSRIFPSPSESLNNPFKLAAFLPLVQKCSESPILAIRKLAARALVPLIPRDEQKSYGERILGELSTFRLAMNHAHGLLLQLEQLTRVQPRLNIARPELVKRLVADCCCPLISAQYMLLINQAVGSQNDINLEDKEEKNEAKEENDNEGDTDEKEEVESEVDKEEQPDVWQLLEQVLVDRMFVEGEETSSSVEAAVSLPADIWKPLLLQAGCVFLASRSLESKDPGILLKLFIHPELKVRGKALQIYKQFLENGGEGLINKGDILNLILGEKKDICLGLLLEICCLLTCTSFQSTDVAYFLSILQVKQAESVVCAVIKLSSLLLCAEPLENAATHSPDLQKKRLELAESLKRCSQPEQPDSVRLAVITAIQENMSLIARPPADDPVARKAFVVFWSIIVDLTYDDDEEIREICIVINKFMTGRELSCELTASSLMAVSARQVGRVWPAAAVFLLVSNIVNNLDLDTDSDTQLDNDKAFDKGEANEYREGMIIARSSLSVLTSFLAQLSPKLRTQALEEQLPGELLLNLVPLLPGGIMVYSVTQLLDYFKVENCWNPSDQTIISMVEKTVRPVVNPA